MDLIIGIIGAKDFRCIFDRKWESMTEIVIITCIRPPPVNTLRSYNRFSSHLAALPYLLLLATSQTSHSAMCVKGLGEAGERNYYFSAANYDREVIKSANGL